MTCACTPPSPTLMTCYVDAGALPESQVLPLQQEVYQSLREALPQVEGWTTDEWAFGFYELLQAFDEVHRLTGRINGEGVEYRALCQTLRGNIGFPEVMASQLSDVVADAYRKAGKRRGVSLLFLEAHTEVL